MSLVLPTSGREQNVYIPAYLFEETMLSDRLQIPSRFTKAPVT